jgi:hypothetical protein
MVDVEEAADVEVLLQIEMCDGGDDIAVTRRRAGAWKEDERRRWTENERRWRTGMRWSVGGWRCAERRLPHGKTGFYTIRVSTSFVYC